MNNREEQNIEGSALPYLPDACLRIIAAFMDLNKSALVSKDFLQVSQETALHLLEAKVMNHGRDDSFIDRLLTAASESLQSYWANNTTAPGTAPPVRIHTRLLFRHVDTIPMVTCMTSHIGPSATLPNGNIATVCSEPDNTCRMCIFDMQSMEFIAATELGFLPRIQGGPFIRGPIDWITDRLFYSNGYLVLHRKFFSSDPVWIHVWKVEGQESIQFLYTKACSITDDTNALQDVAVADDATMYLLWREKQGNREVSYKIESIQVATGQLLNTNTIRMPNTDLQQAKLPRYTSSTLFVAGNYLLMLRYIEEEGPYPGIGLGAYSFSRFDLSESDFLPYFQDYETHLNHDKSGRTSQYIHFIEFTDGGSTVVKKKISIDPGTGKLAVEDGITFGTRSEVVMTTPTSVFTHNPDEEFLGLDEYDLHSGKKLRSLETGLPVDGPHLVASVLASPERGEVFISISGGIRDIHIIQSFLL